MSDQEVQVKISADVQSLLQGMKDAQEHVANATEGMKGDLGALVESFEKLGPAALAMGAVGIAMEGLKEGAASVMEAVKSTDELARSFETLHMRTGASYEDLTVYKNAMVLSGGSMEDFSALLTGLSRKMAQNSDIYIANGIAADKAALQHQDLMTTLAKSVQVIAAVEDPGRRAELAISLLGGRAQAMLPQIMRMNEVIEKDGVEGLKKLGATIDDAAVNKMKALEHATGELKLQIEAVDQKMAESGRGFATWGLQASLAWKQLVDAATSSNSILRMIPGVTELLAAGGQGSHAPALTTKEGGAPAFSAGGSAPKVGQTQQELDAAKAAAAQRIQLAQMSAQEELKAKIDSINAQVAADKHLVDMDALDYDEMISNAKAAALETWEAQQETGNKEIALAQGNAVQIATIRARMADEERAYQKTVQGLDDQAEKHWLEGIQAEEKEDRRQEQSRIAINIEIQKDIEKNQKKRLEGEMRILDQMTSGWDVGIQKMLHGQMSLKDGVEGAMRQMESMVEKSIINMGLQWLKYFVLQQIEGDKAHMTQVMTNAKSAAAAAWNATVGIPFIGPVLAPIAAAASFTGVMAFAEGGWDRVPSDQVAMIHKNEMVLPANIANPLRESLASGGGFGGGNHLHIHAIDAAGVASFVKRPEVQAGFLGLFGSAMRNGRRS